MRSGWTESRAVGVRDQRKDRQGVLDCGRSWGFSQGGDSVPELEAV